MRLLIAITLLSTSIGAFEQEPDLHQPPYSKPPKLKPKFKDDSSTDSRGDYTISGNKDSVRWEKGKLILGDGAILQRRLAAGSWVETELDLTFPILSSDGQTSELQIWLDLEGATDSFVWFRQKRENGKTRSSIFIVDTRGEWNQQSKRRPVTKPLLIDGPLANGKRSINYRHGLWSVFNERAGLSAYGYIKNGVAFGARLVLKSLEQATRVHWLRSSQCSRVTFDPSDGTVSKINEAHSLDDKVVKLHNSGKSSQAIEIAKDVAKIRQSLLGDYHRGYVASQNNLGTLYMSTGSYDKAEPPFIEAREIREEVLGTTHPDYATSLYNLARMYESMGAYSKAEPLFLEAKAILERVLGKEDLDYASNLSGRDVLYVSTGEYPKAEPLRVEAKAIREKVLGKEHPDYARSLNNLASLYNSIGANDKAELLFLESKAIREKVFVSRPVSSLTASMEPACH